MQTVTMYSSAPLSTQLACAVQQLSRQGLAVVVRPLSELSPNPARKQLQRLRDERNALCVQLAVIGDQLTCIEDGLLSPSGGYESGLRADRDSLQARLRGVEAALKTLGGGQGNG